MSRPLRCKALYVALTCSLLGACGSGAPRSGNFSGEKPGEVHLLPGVYSHNTKLLELSDPTFDAEAAEIARRAEGGSHAAKVCVSADMARNPAELIVRWNGSGCKMKRLIFESGTIDIAMDCPASDAGPAGLMTLKGSYAADRYAMTMTRAGKNGAVSKVEVSGTRLGACKD